ncbi:MAG: hypothetical protein V4561_10460 [Bacteroidota bacterium]
MQQEIDTLKKELESTRKGVGVIIHLLEKINGVMVDGFEKVNTRLANLEGKEGMQGVNDQLGDIKSELQKIQKTYPYEDLFNNMEQIKGEA